MFILRFDLYGSVLKATGPQPKTDNILLHSLDQLTSPRQISPGHFIFDKDHPYPDWKRLVLSCKQGVYLFHSSGLSIYPNKSVRTMSANVHNIILTYKDLILFRHCPPELIYMLMIQIEKGVLKSSICHGFPGKHIKDLNSLLFPFNNIERKGQDRHSVYVCSFDFVSCIEVETAVNRNVLNKIYISFQFKPLLH